MNLNLDEEANIVFIVQDDNNNIMEVFDSEEKAIEYIKQQKPSNCYHTKWRVE